MPRGLPVPIAVMHSMTTPGNITTNYYFELREVCKKSKWKFKMAFAMKGGGLEGVSFAIKLF